MSFSSAAPEIQEFPVLYVDDEEQNLLTFRYSMGEQFNVLTSRSGDEALEVLAREPVAVLVCDQRMPGMTGVELCGHARNVRPDAVRVIMTAYADVADAVDAINRGQVNRYLHKPWNDDELSAVLRSGVEMVRLQRLVRRMQARMLQGADVRAVDALREEIARELTDPLGALEIAAEHLADLLSAAAGSDASRFSELLSHAQLAVGDVQRPLKDLSSLVERLQRRRAARLDLDAPVTDLSRAVRATGSMLRQVVEPRGQLRLVLDASPEVPMALADLSQVLMHLVTNALTAASRDERIVPLVTVSVGLEGEQARLEVCDNGPGVEQALRERVFDPFFTTGEGLGLGLSVVRHLVSEAGGSVTLEAVSGTGTRVVVRLPNLAQGS